MFAKRHKTAVRHKNTIKLPTKPNEKPKFMLPKPIFVLKLLKMDMLKHLHWLFIALFLLSYLIKSVLFLINKTRAYQSFRAKTLIFENVMATAFLVTGIWMLTRVGMSNLGGWFHLKLTLVVLAIPLGIVGFKKENKALVLISLLMFLYILGLALTKSYSLV